MNFNSKDDPDAAKGAVEPYRSEDDSEGNVAPLKEQLDHRFQNSLNKSSDSGMPGAGQTPEYSMERQEENKLQQDTNNPAVPRDKHAAAEPSKQDQAHRKGSGKEDPLA
jgi:hypothetical protein